MKFWRPKFRLYDAYLISAIAIASITSPMKLAAEEDQGHDRQTPDVVDFLRNSSADKKDPCTYNIEDALKLPKAPPKYFDDRDPKAKRDATASRPTSVLAPRKSDSEAFYQSRVESRERDEARDRHQTKERMERSRLLWLFEVALSCETKSLFVMSFTQFLAKPAEGLTPIERGTDQNLRKELQEAFIALHPISRSDSGFAIAADIDSHIESNTHGYHRITKPKSLDENGFAKVLTEIQKKIAGKPVRSLAELLKQAGTLTGEEEEVLHLLFASMAPGKLGVLEFLIGQDKANFYRNLVLYGPLSLGPSGHTIGALIANDSGLALPDGFKEKIEALIQGANSGEAMSKIRRALETAPADQLESTRKYLQGILETMTNQGMGPGGQAGDPDATLIAAEKLRTAVHKILGGMHKAVYQGLDPERMRRFLSEDLVQQLLVSEVKPNAESGQIRGLLNAEPQQFSPEFKAKLDKLRALGSVHDPDAKHLKLAQLDLTEEGQAKMQEEINKATANTWQQAWDDFVNPLDPYFHGAALKTERETAQQMPADKRKFLERINEVISKIGIVMTPAQRLALAKLNSYSLEVLASLLETRMKNRGAKVSAKDKEGRNIFLPSLDELIQTALNPKDDDQFSILGSLTWLGDPANPQHALDAVAETLSKSKITIPPDLDLKKFSTMETAQREHLLDVLESQLANHDDLSRHEQDSILLASQIIREWNHEAKAIHSEAANPALSLTYDAHMQNQRILSSQRNAANHLGTEGKKALAGVKMVKDYLLAHNLGLPIGTETALLNFFLQSGDHGIEVMRRWQEMVPHEEYVAMLLSLNHAKGNPADIIFGALKEYSPYYHYLVSEHENQSMRFQARALQDIMRHGKLSDASETFITAIVRRYPDCAARQQSEEREIARLPPGERRAAQVSLLAELSVCVEEFLRQDAAKAFLKDAKKSEAARATGIADPKERAEVLARLKDELQENRLDDKFALDDLFDPERASEVNSLVEKHLVDVARKWHGQTLDTERELAREKAKHAKELRRIENEITSAQDELNTLNARGKGDRGSFSTANLDELLETQKKLSALAASITRAKEKQAGDRVQYRSQREEQAAKAKIAKSNTERQEEYEKLSKREKELAKKQAEANGYGLTEEEVKKRDELKHSIFTSQVIKANNVNPARKSANDFLKRADDKKYSAPLANPGQILSLEKRVARGLSRLKPEAGKSNPAIKELFELRDRLAAYGSMEKKDGKPYSDDELLDLMRKAQPLLARDESKESVSAQLQGWITKCAAGPCALTQAELAYMTKLVQLNGEGKIQLDRISATNTYDENRQNAEAKRTELAKLRDWLLEGARANLKTERQNESMLRTEELAKTKAPGGEEGAHAAVLAQAQSVAEWGRTIADGLPMRPPADSPGRPKYPDPAQPDFAEAAAKWVAATGQKQMVEQWVFQMTKGPAALFSDPEKVRQYFYDNLLRKSMTERKTKDEERQKIEAELAAIVPPTKLEFSSANLWDWSKAKLHQLAPPKPGDADWSPQELRARGYTMSEKRFRQLLNRYSELNSPAHLGLEETYATSGLGSDEFDKFVQEKFEVAGNASYAQAIALNEFSVARLDDSDPKNVHYVFENFAKHKARYEKMARDLAVRLANNGRLSELVASQGGIFQGAERIGANWGNYDPNRYILGFIPSNAPARLLGDVVGQQIDPETGKPKRFELQNQQVGTEADAELAFEMEKTRKQLMELRSLGNAPLHFEESGTPGGTEESASVIAERLGEKFGGYHREQHGNLEQVDQGYELTEEGIWLAADVLTGRAAYGAGAKALKYAADTKKLLWARRLNAMIWKGKRGWLGQNAIKFGQSTIQMGKLGATSPLLSLPPGAYMAAQNFFASAATGDDYVDRNGRTWRDAKEKGFDFHFPDGMREEIDKDNNGIPDYYDVTLYGRSPHTYLVGGAKDLADSVKWGAINMGSQPLAMAGLTAITPILRPLTMLTSRIGINPAYIGTLKPMAGMAISSLATNLTGFNAAGKKMALGEALYEAFWSSLFMAPLDDLVAGATFIDDAKRLVASGGTSIRPETMRKIFRRKSFINHGFDFLQAQAELGRKGEYQTATGQSLKVSPWSSDPAALFQTLRERFRVGAIAVAESAYLSRKTSSFHSSLDLFPKALEAQMRAGHFDGTSAILGVTVKVKEPGLDANGRRTMIERDKSIAEMIAADGELSEYVETRDYNKLKKSLIARSQKLGINPGEIAAAVDTAERHAATATGRVETMMNESVTVHDPATNTTSRRSIRDLISGDRRLAAYTKNKDYANFEALFKDQLKALGVPETELAAAYQRAAEKASWGMRNYADITAVFPHVVRESVIQRFVNGYGPGTPDYIDANRLLNDLDEHGNPSKIHLQITAHDTTALQPNGVSQVRSPEVQKVVAAVAATFGVPAIQLENYINFRTMHGPALGATDTLAKVARELKLGKTAPGWSVTWTP